MTEFEDNDDYEVIEICTDCTMLILNGDLPENFDPDNDDPSVYKNWSLARFEKETSEVTMLGGEEEGDGDAGFSMRDCDLCETSLPGDRFYAARWY